MNQPKTCQLPGCKAESVVGWDSPQTWLCQGHFDAALRIAREVLLHWKGTPRQQPPLKGVWE